MKDMLIGMFIGLFMGVIFGIRCVVDLCRSQHERLDSVGIDQIKYCTVDTDQCHTNYYKIIWKKDYKGQ